MHEAELIISSIEEVQEGSFVNQRIVDRIRVLREEGSVELRDSSRVPCTPTIEHAKKCVSN